MNPYLIDGPASISFSGGRTSGYLLRKILDAHREISDDPLPANVKICFANTGKEFNQTLDFVHECEDRWNVKIHWLEYGRGEVVYQTASRNGEPYDLLIKKKRYLPNQFARFCTSLLKIVPMREFMQSQGFDHWDSLVGIRADEPRRIAKVRSPAYQGPDCVLIPLADNGVTKRDVMQFWSMQDFDLQLKPYQSNCDLCFLKGTGKLKVLMQEDPERALWWIEHETDMGAQFRKYKLSYQQLLDVVLNQRDLFDNTDEITDCFCHD